MNDIELALRNAEAALDTARRWFKQRNEPHSGSAYILNRIDAAKAALYKAYVADKAARKRRKP